MPSPGPPDKEYKGRSFREILQALIDWCRRDRILVGPGSGLIENQTAGGRTLRVDVGASIAFAIIKTNGTITARSSTTPGSGSATIQTWNGTSLANGTSITVRNISGKSGGISSGLYGFAAYILGSWWVIAVECS